ncbi:MAG TPA: ATP-binding protein [Thermoanaerobaculia bacterium]
MVIDPRPQRLDTAREYLQFVTDAAAIAIAHCSAERRFVFVNKAYAERFGLTPDQIAGRSVAEVLGKGAYESIRPYIDRVLAGEPLQYEIDIEYSGIGRRYMHCAYTPEVDAQGRLVGWVAVVTDMTDRRELEQELAERETMLRLAQRAGGVGTFDWDLVTQVARCSSVYFEILGVDSGDGTMTTEEWQAYAHPEDRERVIKHLIGILEDSGAGGADYRVVRPDGEVRWVHYAGQVLRDRTGKPARMIGTVLDITDRKQAEESLREADRRKDEFLATLAHELRNPLAPIRNAAQILQLKGPPDPTLQWARDIIERQAQQLSRLVDDLLDVSRVNRGKVELRKERVELSAIVERALETSRPVLEDAGHRLTVTFPEEPLWLIADTTRMAQALSNLLNNAAKYTEAGGHIRLSSGRDGDRAVVEVRDDGIGIPSEMLSRIFEMFAQVDTSLERAQGGLGIGLTIARSLVEMHGGAIEAASDGSGKGSVFRIRLPLAPERDAADEVQAQEGERMPRASLRILVVDDNEDSAESLAMWLRLQGNHVRTAHDGPQALDVAQEHRPELIFLDIGMPGMNGYEVARRLRGQPETRDAMLVAMTGWGQEEDRRQSKEAGFDQHLVKPLEPKALASLLDCLAPRRE